MTDQEYIESKQKENVEDTSIKTETILVINIVVIILLILLCIGIVNQVKYNYDLKNQNIIKVGNTIGPN